MSAAHCALAGMYRRHFMFISGFRLDGRRHAQTRTSMHECFSFGLAIEGKSLNILGGFPSVSIRHRRSAVRLRNPDTVQESRHDWMNKIGIEPII